MLARHCLKISSTAKLLNKLPGNTNKFGFISVCHSSNAQSFRNLSQTTNLNNPGPKLIGSELNISPGLSKSREKYNNFTSEELLEKLIASLSADIHQKNRVYKNDLLRVIGKIKELNFCNRKQGLLLIQCCGDLLPDETAFTRTHLLEQVWDTIKPHTKFTVEHYNELLKVYIANNKIISVNNFISQMGNIKPNLTTYELILRVLGEVGDINQATEVITNMKGNGLPATESIFNSLIICQGKAGPHTKFTVEHYNELLKVYIANNKIISVNNFISQMGNIKPNLTTYELILRVLGEVGDINQATEVITNMKGNGLPATESIFNSLIICQGKAGLQNIQEVLTMMKSLKLEPTIDTYTEIARSYAWHKNNKQVLEEMNKAVRSGLVFGEKQIMYIVKTLAAVGEYKTISQVLKYLPEDILNTPSISPYMQSVCTLLVFQNHPLAALEIYKCLPLPSFGPKDDQGLHGRSLVRDCVKASMTTSVIGLVTQELMSSGRNPIAIQNASEIALQLGKVPLALDLFTRMKQLGMPLRPHYFWPILLHTSKTYGEKGIMNTISTMVSMDVNPDYDTIMEYCLPYVSFTSPQNLMKKFLETGLGVSTVLTPMMVTLLNTGQVRAASEICELFIGKVDAEKLLKPLLKGYLTSKDTVSTTHVLEDISERAINKNKDWIGRFLCLFIQHKKVAEDMTEFMDLVKQLKSKSVKISMSAADFCVSRMPDKFSQVAIDNLREVLLEITDDKLIDEEEIIGQSMPHPKHMNEENLTAHLSELEAKGMNTRGVLRKLLQQYCRDGNLQAAKGVVEKCKKEGVFLSAGMKAAIFDLHVKSGELDLAEMVLADLTKTSPNFVLDEFKVIDFATLMVYQKKVKKAFDLITDQSKRRRVMGGRSIAMNCWRLLDATAANCSPAETKKMFELITSLRYCQPSNVLLGPLIRVHLKKDNIQEAVSEFVRLSKQYNKTPLKHELLSRVMQDMADGKTEDTFIVNEKTNGRLNKLAQTILNIDKKIHGAGDVQLTLMSALAEVGYKKTLRKLFLDPTVKFHPDALMRRCERFADERKVRALETIAESAKDLRQIDVAGIYNLILDVYQRDDDWKSALKLWTKIQEDDVTPSQKFVQNLCALLSANNRAVPAELSVLNKTVARNTS